VSAADWIVHARIPWEQLVNFGPPDFPAYARLRFIPDPTKPGQVEGSVDVAEGPPVRHAANPTSPPPSATLHRHTRGLLLVRLGGLWRPQPPALGVARAEGHHPASAVLPPQGIKPTYYESAV